MRFKQVCLIGLIALIVVVAVYVAMSLAGQEYGLQRYGIETAGLFPKLPNAMA